jgi:hypothetical protein
MNCQSQRQEQNVKTQVHAAAGTLALATVLIFWISTAASELAGTTAWVVAVKTAVPWGMLLLIPCLATAGATGLSLARGRSDGPVAAKRRRMPFIAANGALVLLPAALFLAAKAAAGSFDVAFALVQAVELLAGAVNIALLGANLRDGLKLRGRRRVQVAHAG